MAIEYYVKRDSDNRIIHTCETSEQAVRDAEALNKQFKNEHFRVFYSEDALAEYKRNN